MGIFLRQNPEVFKELSRMCIFHTHHPTSQFSGMKKKSFEKQGQISREKSLICEKKRTKMEERKQSFDVVWISMSAIIVSNICGGDLPIKQASLSLSLVSKREREKERKRSTLFDGALTKYLAKLLQLLLRCGSYVEDTHSHTHTKMEK